MAENAENWGKKADEQEISNLVSLFLFNCTFIDTSVENLLFWLIQCF